MRCFPKMYRLFVYLCFIGYGYGQSPPVTHYSTATGLPSNTIRSIYKDSRGLLWIGTSNGMVVDQYGKIVRIEDAQGNPLLQCWAIAEDAQGKVWLGSYSKGLSVYDGQKITHFTTANGLIHNQVRKLLIHRDYIYVGTTHGISRIHTRTYQITNWIPPQLSDRFQVMGFFEHQQAVYVLTYVDGLWKVTEEGLEKVRNNPDPYGAISVYKQGDGVYSDDQDPFIAQAVQFTPIASYIHSAMRKERYFGNTHLWDYATDKRGIVYAAGYGVDYPTGGLMQLSASEMTHLNTRFGIPSDKVWALHYDTLHDWLYVGTLDQGLFRIDLTESIQHVVDTPSHTILGFESLGPTFFRLSKKQLAIERNGQTHTLSLADFNNFAIKYITANGNWEHILRLYPNMKTEELELKSMQVHRDQLWVGSSRGMYILDNKGQFIRFFAIRNNNTFGFSPTDELLSPLPYSGIEIFSDLHSPNEQFIAPAPHTPVDIAQVLTSRHTTYLISRSKGLFSYQKGQFQSYAVAGIWEETELVQAKLNAQHQLIIAHASGDVYIAEEQPKFTITHHIPRTELLGSNISFIETYGDYVLIGNEKGLFAWNAGKIRWWNQEQGLNPAGFRSCKLIGNQLYIGTDNGYTVMDLDRLLSNNSQPYQVALTAVEVNYQPIPMQPVWLNIPLEVLHLKHHQNTLNLQFVVQQASSPEKLRYRYRLNGMDGNQWSEWSAIPQIQLPYLPAGSFAIEVEIYDYATGHSTQHTLLQVHIAHPFWKTPQFILSFIILLSLTVYALYRFRIRQINQQAQQKVHLQKRLADTRMEALLSQMNPHFIFNAMNSIQHYILDHDTDNALAYLGEFSRLIRTTLNYSSKMRISLEEELAYLSTYIKLETMRTNHRINVQVNVDESIDTFAVEIPPMLIQPFLENAFIHAFDQHSQNPTITLAIYQTDDQLHIRIQDNGKGMSTALNAPLTASKGMKLAKERLELFTHNTTLEIQSELQGGTVIELKLPIYSL